mgnify:CR=1 FL=1
MGTVLVCGSSEVRLSRDIFVRLDIVAASRMVISGLMACGLTWSMTCFMLC